MDADEEVQRTLVSEVDLVTICLKESQGGRRVPFLGNGNGSGSSVNEQRYICGYGRELPCQFQREGYELPHSGNSRLFHEDMHENEVPQPDTVYPCIRSENAVITPSDYGIQLDRILDMGN